jgi:hypothetical protein
VAQLKASEMTTQATMKETCETCGRKEVRFSERQLRGADEGSTIFYECDCGHKYAFQVEIRQRLLTMPTDGLQTISLETGYVTMVGNHQLETVTMFS